MWRNTAQKPDIKFCSLVKKNMCYFICCVQYNIQIEIKMFSQKERDFIRMFELENV